MGSKREQERKTSATLRRKAYNTRKGRKNRLGRLEREKMSVHVKDALVDELKGTETKLKKAVVKVLKKTNR